MAKLEKNLELSRCPTCGIDNPNLVSITNNACETAAHDGSDHRFYRIYTCIRCGYLVIAYAYYEKGSIDEIVPFNENVVDENVPEKARGFLEQARDSFHAPSGSTMLSASAVDAMLQEKGYVNGKLFERINKAAADNLITSDMAKWAHQVRLDANNPRHSDDKKPLPDREEAKKTFDFAQALAEFLFVLPSKVTQGIKESAKKK